MIEHNLKLPFIRLKWFRGFNNVKTFSISSTFVTLAYFDHTWNLRIGSKIWGKRPHSAYKTFENPK